jgi:hypothetical protein
MPQYLVELYVARTSPMPLEAARRARASANAMSRDGLEVHYLHSIFVPEDEICFLLFEAATPELVGEAGRRAALDHYRILQAIGET